MTTLRCVEDACKAGLSLPPARALRAPRVPMASLRAGGLLLLSSGLLGLAQCDYTTPAEHRLTSLQMTLHTPSTSELGTPSKPQRADTVMFDVQALDERGQLMPVSPMVNAFLAAGGSRLSLYNPCAAAQPVGSDPSWLLQRFALSDGRAQGIMSDLTDPVIFGRVELNLEDPTSQALGSSPPLYFPNPSIARVMRPVDVNAENASFCSPLLNRQVVIDGSEAGGKLVVSSLFQSGLSISDTSTPEYGSLYIYTFSQPAANLHLGTVVSRMAGAIAKFNGMSQLSNPAITATPETRLDLVPQPVELDRSRLPDNKAKDKVNNKWLTQYIAAPARITGVVCEVTADATRKGNWEKYNTVVVNLVDADPASVAGCSPGTDFGFSYFSVQLPGKGFGGLDPVTMAGRTATFTGMLQNSASKSGKTLYWTVTVRTPSDVCLMERAMCVK